MALSSCFDKSILVHLLICIFGTCSWLAINGIWVELPLLVQKLPEKWALPSYMSVVIQLANIGPISYTLLTVFAPSILRHEKVIILLIITMGATSCLLLSFFWDYTTFIAGQMHSTALLILEFFLALVDCTSSVAFFPVIANFKEKYMTSYFIGEGLSGLLPGFAALAQGASIIKCVNTTVNTTTFENGTWDNFTEYVVFPQYQEPNFPAQDFFLFLFVMTLISGVAFCLVVLLPHFQDEKSQNNNVSGIIYSRKDGDLPTSGTATTVVDATISPCSCTEPVREGQSASQLLNQEDKVSSDDEDNTYIVTKRELKRTDYLYLLFLTATINCLSNGVLPSIQSYACLPYGNKPFSLSVLLSIMANPIACFLAYFLPTKNFIYISFLTVIGCCFAGYDLTLAALSPNPFLRDETLGSTLLILSWILVSGFFSYTKVCIAVIFRTQGRRGLLWYGALTQAGSAVGSLIMFFLVNVLQLFTAAQLCPN